MHWSSRRERDTSAQLTQARKDGLRSHSSEGQKASGKSDALFSSEQGNLIRSSVLRNAKQELHVESLNKCISELLRQTEEQRLAVQDAQYGFVESRREQVRLQEDCL